MWKRILWCLLPNKIFELGRSFIITNWGLSLMLFSAVLVLVDPLKVLGEIKGRLNSRIPSHSLLVAGILSKYYVWYNEGRKARRSKRIDKERY